MQQATQAPDQAMPPAPRASRPELSIITTGLDPEPIDPLALTYEGHKLFDAEWKVNGLSFFIMLRPVSLTLKDLIQFGQIENLTRTQNRMNVESICWRDCRPNEFRRTFNDALIKIFETLVHDYTHISDLNPRVLVDSLIKHVDD